MSNEKKRGTGKYSEKEVKAYNMGRAYAMAKAGKRVACKTDAEKTSFRNGVSAVRKAKNGGGKKK